MCQFIYFFLFIIFLRLRIDKSEKCQKYPTASEILKIKKIYLHKSTQLIPWELYSTGMRIYNPQVVPITVTLQWPTVYLF